MRLIDPEAGREYARLEDPHQDRAGDLCFSHDGARLVASSSDTPAIHVWDLAAIRRELRAMGLDWDLPPYPRAGEGSGVHPLTSVEIEPLDAPGWRAPGESLARTGETAKAVAAYRRAYEVVAGDVESGRWWATLALDSGDAAEYRRACEQLRDRFGKTDGWFQAVHVCWTFMQAEDSVPDRRFLLELGTNLVKAGPELAWTHTTLAGAQLRNGEHESALRSLDESDRLGRDWHARVTNDFLRAIALFRLGRAGEARSVFEKGALYADSHLAHTPAAPFGEISENHAWDWYTIRLLRREAEELLHTAEADNNKSE